MCGQLYDWRKPNRLLTLQFGDMAKEQVVFPAYRAPGGDCDNMISALELVTNLIKGKMPQRKTCGSLGDFHCG